MVGYGVGVERTVDVVGEFSQWAYYESKTELGLSLKIEFANNVHCMQASPSITAREIFRRCPDVKKQLWGGEL